MVVCGRISDLDVYNSGARQASVVARVNEVPAVPSSKEAVDGVYDSSDSERLEARRYMGVAASVDIGHVGIRTATR